MKKTIAVFVACFLMLAASGCSYVGNRNQNLPDRLPEADNRAV